jgi:hypothetical protein
LIGLYVITDGVVDCDVSLQRDADGHEDGAAHGHALCRIQEVGEKQRVQVTSLEKNNSQPWRRGLVQGDQMSCESNAKNVPQLILCKNYVTFSMDKSSPKMLATSVLINNPK